MHINMVIPVNVVPFSLRLISIQCAVYSNHINDVQCVLLLLTSSLKIMICEHHTRAGGTKYTVHILRVSVCTTTQQWIVSTEKEGFMK